MRKTCLAILSVVSVFAFAYDPRPAAPYFPDVEGYKTLICDYHTHTVFSDGQVWPSVRIDEARREGLDVIALSDHVEYQPHKDDLPTHRDRPYEIALGKSQEFNILLIKGAEITKDTPPGHYNAVLVTAIDPLNEPNVMDGVRIAAGQNAFVFWNHHAWKGEDRGRWEALQTAMYENKWLHGMEVANGKDYYPNAHQWCLDKKLTMLGNSDIHAPSIDGNYTAYQHRTLTLTLAKERSVDSVKEALFAGRTIVWHENRLIGRPEHLKLIYDAAVTVSPIHFTRGNRGYFEIANRSLLDLQLVRSGKTGPRRIAIPPQSVVVESVELDENKSPLTLSYKVENMLIAPDTGLPVTMEVRLP
jgi:hypothetical protein